MRISTIRHPEYQDDAHDFFKWRLTYKGGRHFIDRYLERFSTREDDADFKSRRCISYAPTFAKAGINKLKNTFYSRMSEIRRIEGSASYVEATSGKGGGVDLFGSSMNAFMGQDVLQELMTMKRVGIYVDRKPFNGPTKADNRGNKPYLYYYRTEDILTWDYVYNEGEYLYRNVLLRDYEYFTDPVTGMVAGTYCRFRQVWLGDDGKVRIQYWREADDPNATDDIKDGPEIETQLTRIPFVFGGLQESLIADVCDYQITMLNLASADANYVFKANFPFYTEEFDPVSESIYMRRPAPGRTVTNVDRMHSPNPADGSADTAQIATTDEINVGSMRGRRFPKGSTPPSFIAPPTEPLQASMAKQQRMKEEIFELIDIAASNAVPQHASADSKAMDDRGLESGLSYIGLELEYMEREVAKIWAEYENAQPATVNYPQKYSLKSDADRLSEAAALDKVKMSTPSATFAKEVGKEIVHVMLSDKVDSSVIEKINAEIDKAEYASSDPKLIQIASELGMVDAVTGSNALGFNGERVVPMAQKEHADRLAMIAKSQAVGGLNNPSARGVQDGGPIAGADASVAAGN